MPKTKIYIFSGLGANESVFQLLDFSDYNIHFIKWIYPSKNESIEDYAKRIIVDQIKDPSPIFIGLSFGGIMAIEVAKLLRVQKLIIIASIKQKQEIPFYYRLAGNINLHKIPPTKILKKPNAISNWLFGASSFFEKEILKNILSQTDPIFLKWAINCIVRWKHDRAIPNITHIHGTKDRLLPPCFLNSDYKIQDGGHFMTLSHSREIMELLNKELQK